MKTFIALLTIVIGLVSQTSFANSLSISVKNPDGSAVDTVIIYATPLDFPAPERPPRSIVITQKEWAFTPFMSVAQRTDNIEFTNSDNFTHHIYSLSDASRFSFKLKPGEAHSINTQASTLEKEIAMGCNIHDWMSGFMLLVDTPYFEQTVDGNLSFSFEQAGKYQLTLWHPQLKTDTHRVEQVIDTRSTTSLVWELPTQLTVKLPQVSQDEFDFLDKY